MKARNQAIQSQSFRPPLPKPFRAPPPPPLEEEDRIPSYTSEEEYVGKWFDWLAVVWVSRLVGK